MDGTLIAAAGWGEGLIALYVYALGFWLALICILDLLAMLLPSPRTSRVATAAFFLVTLFFQPWIAIVGLGQTPTDPDFANDYKYQIAVIVMWLFTLVLVCVSQKVAHYRDQHIQLPPSDTLR